MNIKSFLLRKRIIIPFFLIFAFVAYYQYIYYVPKTQPNVNHKPIHNLELEEFIITNKWGETMVAESGRFTVNEERSNPESNKIELYFHRLKSSNPSPLPPVIFLAGGPGGSGTRIGTTEYFYLFKSLRENGDVILLDQRGTGKSIPNLACRNSLALPTDITDNVKEELLKSVEDKCRECASDLKSLGIQLSAYNSVESADDIEEIRQALGYDKITLYGVSYGTQLAQFYIRKYEQNVAKSIFAGPIAPDQDLKFPAGVQSQFDGLDSLVKLDKKMSKYIPDFNKLVQDVHQKLKEKPQFIQIPLMDAVSDDDGAIPTAIFKTISLFRPFWNLTLTDEHLQMISTNYIGRDDMISRFPNFYYEMGQGNFKNVGNILRNFRRKRMPNAVIFTVNGSTGYSRERLELALQQEKKTVFSNFGISFGRYPEIYKAFGIEKQSGWNEPVYSGTEILLIGGTLDGRTPISQLDTLARRFPNNKKIIIQNAGHNRLMDNTIKDGILAFLQDTLHQDIDINRTVAFLNVVHYKYDLADTMMTVINSEGLEKAIALHQNLLNEYDSVDDFIYDFREHTLNSLAYQLMGNGQYEEAQKILLYNIELYPNSYNLYNSLSEAQLNLKDTITALQNLEKAIHLNYFDGYSQAMLARLKGLNDVDI